MDKKQLDNKIEDTLKKEFSLPDRVKTAQQKAFAEIRQRSAEGGESRMQGETEEKNWQQTQQGGERKMRKSGRKGKKLTVFTRALGGMAAAAAVFSGICITNPALASNIPLIGHVFEELGTSMGFSGDFSGYARPLESEDAGTAAEAVDPGSDSTAVLEKNGGEDTAAGVVTQTVNGVTVTLSEVYCNEVALYLSLLIQSEKPLPDTMVNQAGKPILDLQSARLAFSYNPDFPALGSYLDGKQVDENTYAGVMRVNLEETNVTYSKEGTVDADSIQHVTIPDTFTLDLNIPEIIGYLPEDQVTIPQMPQEFQDAYDQAMAEQGLDSDNYENFTEDQQNIEHELFQEMQNKYQEAYPETGQYPNAYENWWFDGDWSFSLDITKDTSQTITKEVNLLDENGAGIVSVTRTPFEISLQTVDPEADYVCVVLDADGKQLETGDMGGSLGSLAIQDSNVDTIDLYVLDYYAYMDEIKGWRLEENDVEAQQGKSYKQLLDERAVLHTEVTF